MCRVLLLKRRISSFSIVRIHLLFHNNLVLTYNSRAYLKLLSGVVAVWWFEILLGHIFVVDITCALTLHALPSGLAGFAGKIEGLRAGDAEAV